MSKKNLLRAIALALFVCTFGACATSTTKAGKAPLVLYPAPPEPTKIQFLTRFSNSMDLKGARTGFQEFVMGKEPGKPIIKPYGLATAAGKIYIADTILAGFEVIDLAGQKLEYFQPGGRGKLRKPINCATDEAGRLYVADADRKDIVVFDASGEYSSSIGAGVLEKPTDVFVTEDKVFAVDVKQQKVKVFSRADSSLVATLPADNLPKEQGLFSPVNLFVKGGKLYVSDFGDFRVKVYSMDGKFERAIGSYGRGLGQFVRPKGIAVDDDNNIYVVDAGFENVQIFSPDGKLLLFFGGTYKGPGDMWLPAKVVIDHTNLSYFQQYVDSSFQLVYLIFVTNQYGPDKVSVYGFVKPKG